MPPCADDDVAAILAVARAELRVATTRRVAHAATRLRACERASVDAARACAARATAVRASADRATRATRDARRRVAVVASAATRARSSARAIAPSRRRARGREERREGREDASTRVARAGVDAIACNLNVT
jgi:hypothetical protein